jgi:DNA polymerase elongation subunit (family B)
MYQNIYINRKDWIVHLWDDIKGYSSFPYPKYAYKRQVGGPEKSIYGDELVKVFDYKDNDTELFESDVPAETRVLMDTYSDSDEPSIGHRVGVIDIEVSTEGGFPNIETADKKITAISLFDYLTKTCCIFVLDKDHKIDNKEEEVDPWLPKDWKITTEEIQKIKIVVRSYDDEDNLLIDFVDKWQECAFTIVTGWNVDYFDLPYLYLRLKNCLGIKAAKCLSPTGAAYVNGFTKKLTLGGISVLDYILLYKKFSGKMEPTYALGPIGLKTVGIGKIQYHGNLDDLYKSDINKFLEYNMTDVKIIVALDKKLKFIDLARNICHVGHVPYDNFHMSSRYLDGATLIYLKRNGGLISPNKPAEGKEEYTERLEEGEEGFSGAFVKEPVPGRYNWVFDLDLTSMYPNIIISLNISPETKVGKIENYSLEKRIKGETTMYEIGQTNYTPDEFEELVEKSNYSISSNGILYRTDKAGVIPTLLSLWFQQRKNMRKKAAEFKKAGDMEQYNFYNQRQAVWKILLNSFYGVLGLPLFRFYDVDNAEAVTTTGVDIIQTTAKAINIYYKQALETDEDGDWVIYSDTDSCFVDSIPIIKKRFPDIDLNNEDEMTKAIMSVTTEVQSYVNQFYHVMAKKFFNLNKHTFDAKQEVISKSSFWLAKKRYAQWIIHEEGALLKQPRLEVKGIDVVRTSFPASFRTFMDSFLRKLLTAAPKKELDDMILKFREDIKTLDVLDIAKNTSVKFVSQDGVHNYNPDNRRPLQFVKGTPAQVKACLAYNDLLIKMKLEKQFEPIHHGQKIKWVYLQDNQYNLDALALKGDGNDPDEILEIVNRLVDRKKMFEQELKSKLIDFYNVFKWTFPNSSMETASQFFDFS